MYKPITLDIKDIMSYDDVSYSFRTGEAVLVIGENKDDPGQLRNGAGKSGINEAIAIALTGDTIRSVKTKEVIRRGQQSGEVILTLESPQSEILFRIWRRIHAGSKSSEVKIWLNGAEHIYADVNEYNRVIFDILGISKDDFYDFFLITKQHYKPFLNVGDTVKKAIINRFSGADKVDDALPKVQKDIDEVSKRIGIIELQIAQVKGKQDVVSDSILEEQIKYSEEKKQEKIAELTQKKKSKEFELTVNEDFVIAKQQAQKALRNEIAKISLTDYASQMKEYEDAIAEAQKEYDALVVVGTKTRNDVESNKNRQAALQNIIAGSIECPKCLHNFSLKEKGMTMEQVKRELSLLQKALPTLEKKLLQDRTTAREYDEAIKAVRLSLKELQDTEQAELKVKSDKQRALASIDTEIRNASREVEFLKSAIKEFDDEILSLDDSESKILDELNAKLAKYIDEETEWNDELADAHIEKSKHEKWIVNFKNFKSYLANKSIKNIQDYTNLYLQQMKTNLSIVIDGYKVLSNKKMKEEITVSVQRNGFDAGSYGSFSAGEQGRIDVAVIMAIQSLINLNSPSGGLDLCVNDEIFDSIDSLGLECIIGSLQSVGKTIMIVSQVEINALTSQTLIVRKENGLSKLII
jgi:DNA repair exonuclease SbcCD ATPase subunit